MNLKLNFNTIILGFFAATWLMLLSCNASSNSEQAADSPAITLDNAALKYVTQNPAQIVLSKQATIKPIQATGFSYKAFGTIQPDVSINKSINANFDGRIEKLWAQFDYQYIQKGTPVMEVYSASINTFIAEFQLLLKNNAAPNLVAAAKEKLKVLGIQDFQLEAWAKQPSKNQNITIYSPVSGYFILKKPASVHGPMHEGDYFFKGQTLFYVNDLNRVWAIISLPNIYYPQTENLKKITLNSELYPNKKIEGKIVFREKSFEHQADNFFKLRVEIADPQQQLKINSLITAEIPLLSDLKLEVPASAVIRTGRYAYVWKKIDQTDDDTKVFQLTKVMISSIQSDKIYIHEGLETHDEIALHAAYLADSETNLYSNSNL